MIHLLPPAAFRHMPWKNGLGVTIEIAAGPEGASLDAIDWRVSMARVETAGPFSLFPGIDRTLAVLEGQSLTLEIAGRNPVRLDQDSAPYAFPADVATFGTPDAGGILDLNVMTRRGRWRHRVRRAQGAIDLTGEVNLLVNRGDTVWLGDHELVAGGTAMLDAGPVDLASRVYAIELFRT